MVKWLASGMLALSFLSFAEKKVHAQAQTAPADMESVLVYRSIAVTVNKSVIIHLPKRAIRVVVTQPQIAEAVLIAPNQLLINGKSVGTTSLVVWTEEPAARKK
jgi:Flp pilus assembly secretin CpaC